MTAPAGPGAAAAGGGKAELVKNAAGRLVPAIVNGKQQAPFAGVDRHPVSGRKAAPPIVRAADYPANGDKRVKDLRTALDQCGLKNGMVISSHHHLRNGDRIALEALKTAAAMGVKDLLWFPSASFPCHEPVIELHGERRRASPRGEHERPDRGLLLAGEDAGARRPPFARRALAGDPGRRGRTSTSPSSRRRQRTPSGTRTAPSASRPAARSASRWPIPCMPTR